MILGRRCISLGPWLDELRAARGRAPLARSTSPSTKRAPLATVVSARAKFSALDAKPPARTVSMPIKPVGVTASELKAPARLTSGPTGTTAVSSFEVLLSAAAFAAAASGVAMWFVH